MDARWVAVIMVATVLTGCGADGERPGAVERRARITVGDHTVTTTSFHCTQSGWSWLFDAGDGGGTVDAALRPTEDGAEAQWVKVRDLGGFTGSYWTGGVGDATASVDGTTFTVAGTLYGAASPEQNVPSSERFELVAEC
ncbi:hypothetical protein E4P42_12100 [Mycobacterium sp. PS03-16]|uniref:lipoprotein LpqH n=1 Tax=Mycobacterium sp. PS03-16 TaxID=2559611 RepID=UPI0010730E5A|nr:lipoprotein LpqH [Mycobacterium sp. PS03-16]TFV58438.1 hypothetical protein E4P42_12100 [Mycobacterium sp. PS03-16]